MCLARKSFLNCPNFTLGVLLERHSFCFVSSVALYTDTSSLLLMIHSSGRRYGATSLFYHLDD